MRVSVSKTAAAMNMLWTFVGGMSVSLAGGIMVQYYESYADADAELHKVVIGRMYIWMCSQASQVAHGCGWPLVMKRLVLIRGTIVTVWHV